MERPRKRGRRRAAVRAATTLLLALCACGWAQSFVFTSSRFSTLDLFHYEDGRWVQILVTRRVAEVDPSPAPVGGLIAYATTTFLNGFTDPDDSWRWEYRLTDHRGFVLQRWRLEGSERGSRPPAGFEAVWLPDGRSFLGQSFDPAGGWGVRRYFVGSERIDDLGAGYGILLRPDATAFAVTRAGNAFLVELEGGRETPLGPGYALAWLPDGSGLLIERGFELMQLPPDRPEAVRALGVEGPFLRLRWRPDGERYAYTTIVGDDEALAIRDRDHALVRRHESFGIVADFAWLDEGGLIAEVFDGSAWTVVALDDGGEAITLLSGTGGAGVAPLPR